MFHEGDIVRLNGAWPSTKDRFGMNNYMRTMGQRGWYAEVTNVIDPTSVYLKTLSSKLKVLHGAKTNQWDTSDLSKTVLPLHEALEIQDTMDQIYDGFLIGAPPPDAEQDIISPVSYSQSRKSKVDVAKIAAQIIKINPTPFSEINYLNLTPETQECRKDMYIGSTRIMCGNIVDNTFRLHKLHHPADCCFLFSTEKASQDVVVSIPQDWCNYMGYSEEVVINWINFIKELCFPFKIDYLGKEPYRDHHIYPYGGIHGFFIQTNAYYNISLPNTELNCINYLAFLLIRYLFLSEYNVIPGLCLQIKEKTDLSNWEILMTVHSMFFHPNKSLYGIYVDSKSEETLIIDVADCNNSELYYLKRLKKTGSINYSFIPTYVKKQHQDKIFNILKEKQFDKIREWINEIPQNKGATPVLIMEMPAPKKFVKKPAGQFVGGDVRLMDLGEVQDNEQRPRFRFAQPVLPPNPRLQNAPPGAVRRAKMNYMTPDGRMGHKSVWMDANHNIIGDVIE